MTASRVNRGARRAGREPDTEKLPALPVDHRHPCFCHRLSHSHTIGQHPEFWLHPPVQGIR